MCCFISYHALSHFGIVPPTKVVTGDSLRQTDIDLLKKEGYLREDEDIIYFYSGGLSTIDEHGAFFTNLRVVTYGENEEGQFYDWAKYPEIANIELSYDMEFPYDALITVARDDNYQFVLMIATEEELDRTFYEALKDRWLIEQFSRSP